MTVISETADRTHFAQKRHSNITYKINGIMRPVRSGLHGIVIVATLLYSVVLELNPNRSTLLEIIAFAGMSRYTCLHTPGAGLAPA